jgi:hypothetical protein
MEPGTARRLGETIGAGGQRMLLVKCVARLMIIKLLIVNLPIERRIGRIHTGLLRHHARRDHDDDDQKEGAKKRMLFDSAFSLALLFCDQERLICPPAKISKFVGSHPAQW